MQIIRLRAEDERLLVAAAGLLVCNWSVRLGEEWRRVESALGPGGATARLDY